jgi:ribosomal protein S18 acetylase RimI-like enzyme
MFNVFKGFLNGDFSFPSFSRDYPATFHVNIDTEYRGQGVGSRLIENYLNYLKEEKIKGVHFGTMSESAKKFFLKLGFELLFETETIYLRYYFKRKLPYYIFGKKL